MAFHFTLEAALRFRRSLEEQQRLRLETLVGRRASLLSELELLRQSSFRLQQETRHAMLRHPTPAVEIHFATARLEGLQHRQQQLEEQRRELQTTIGEQRRRFQQQRRDREALESLRDEQWHDYRLWQQRREQARLDELHLLLRQRTVSH